MEKDDKGSTLIRIGVSGESSFWYRPTRVVPDQRPLNGRCCISQVIDCEDRLRNDLYCVECGVKLYSNSKVLSHETEARC